MTVSKLLVGLLVAALLLAVMRDGPGGPAKWMRAKFLGETS